MMKEVDNATKLTTGYLRGYPWGKDPFIKTYEYEFHPGRALGKPSTAECRWDQGFSLISNEPVPSSWYGERQKLLDPLSKTQKVSASSGSSSVVKTDSSSVSLGKGPSAEIVGGPLSPNVRTPGNVTAAAVAVTPLAAGVAVGAVAAGFYGVANMIKYARNEKSGKQAAKDTMVGSAGVGVSAGLGIAAANAIAGTSLAFGSAVVAPIAAGVAAAYAGITIWHKLFLRGKSPSKTR